MATKNLFCLIKFVLILLFTPTSDLIAQKPSSKDTLQSSTEKESADQNLNSKKRDPVFNADTNNKNKNLWNLSLDELMDTKVASGSFLELDMRNSAFSLSIISREEIELSGARHLSELLEIYVPGFQYMYSKWYGIIWGMRGVAADRNSKFIFLINGRKMNTEARDGANMETDLGLLGDVERVEVIRGPSGLIYGSGAISGIINMVTKKYKRDEFIASTTQGTWSGDTYFHQYEAWLGKSLLGKKDASIVLSGGYRVSDGVGQERARLYGRPSFPYPQFLDNPPPDGVPVSGSPWSTPGNARFSVDFNYKRFRLYSRYTHQVTNASGFFIVDPWADFTGMDSLAPDRIVDGKFENINGWYGNIEPGNVNRRQYVVNNITNQLTYTIPTKHDNIVTLYGGLDLNTDRIQLEELKGYTTLSPSERHVSILETFGERRYSLGGLYLMKNVPRLQWASGYEFRLFDIGRDMSGRNSRYEIKSHPVVSNVVYVNNAVFSEAKYNLTEKVDVLAGLRYDIHTRTAFIGGVLTPKAAIILKPDEQNVIKVIYQTSANNGSADNYEFDRNSFNDNGEPYTTYHYETPFMRPGPGTSVIPPVTLKELHKLKPERSSSFEITSMNTIGDDKINIKPSISYNTVKDLLLWNQKLFRIVNAGYYHFVNLELDFAFKTNTISIGANHVYSRVVRTDVMDQYKYFDLAVFNGFDSVTTDGKSYQYFPKPIESKAHPGTDSVMSNAINAVRDQITVDGKNFLNLNTNITKLYLNYKPASWISIHTDFRLFWGLTGRKDIHQYDTTKVNNPNLNDYAKNYAFNNKFPFLGIENHLMVKWDVGLNIRPGKNILIAFYGYDLLAWVNKLQTLRWQQSADIKEQTDLYSVDYSFFSFRLDYKFGL
ncbi:MAG: TonB-dependent receptor plug domain-containing protein [Sporocytophaga sp.]|uniref:TonB-dependent receptor plug domain-containing protein n=1 Tax=Sporocytophaga sp. TaxID=2231183 RepID=UPI001B150464|nr:TonB-dependent receptor plug domain-containing protein [Sporocytophaga sp.]MBO9698899.1 TonB-dependent receptor plug domain-containing protein [Sporocytophaga sp.]